MHSTKRIFHALMNGTHQLMADLIYGGGLKVMECTRLRVKDIDFAMNQMVVGDGKGRKDHNDLHACLNRGGKGVKSPLDFTA